MIIYLIGYMGSGKSTLGRVIARDLGFRFADTDREVEREQGMSVADIFAAHGGEGRFRECERATLERLSRQSGDMIVSTGGGLPCHGGNAELMRAAGRTVYLRRSPESLTLRLREGAHKRPLLAGLDCGRLEAFVAENVGAREPIYMAADFVVECDGKSDDEICRRIADYVRGEGV